MRHQPAMRRRLACGRRLHRHAVVDRKPERIGGLLSWTVHPVAVSQTFRGSVETFITLVPGDRPAAERIAESNAGAQEVTMMSSCDYDFQPGRQYLIYARRTAEGRWTTSMCTGTKPLEDAAADLDYLATIPGAEPTGRVYGSVERTVANPADRSTSTTVPAAGVQVALVSGASRITTRTDKEGKIDVQVPPGQYTIAPVVPETVRVYGHPFQASVPARGCASVHFSLIANGRIEGRVVRPDGTPVPNTAVNVVPPTSLQASVRIVRRERLRVPRTRRAVSRWMPSYRAATSSQ